MNHMIVSTDQIGREVHVPFPPQRIISLVPSQTELLFDLGLAGKMVGVTKFCIHPADQIKRVQIIGGTKKFSFSRIDDLQPDLIIGNKEENYQDGIDRLTEKYPVWMSDVISMHDAFQMMTEIGRVTDTHDQAMELVGKIKEAFDNIRPLPNPRKAAYLIWQKPYMAVGCNTFINTLLEYCGFENVFSDPARGRYPEITLDDIAAAAPDYLFLSSEPFPFKEKHKAQFLSQLTSDQIVLVNGEYFSWYGSRLLSAAEYLNQLVASLTSNMDL